LAALFIMAPFQRYTLTDDTLAPNIPGIFDQDKR
jgi:hypothetical protein